MAYASKDVIKLGGGPHVGNTLWMYRTTDAMTTVDDTDYFAGGKFLGMKTGDPVIVIKTDGPNFYLTAVSAIDADGNVTVGAATTVL